MGDGSPGAAGLGSDPGPAAAEPQVGAAAVAPATLPSGSRSRPLQTVGSEVCWLSRWRRPTRRGWGREGTSALLPRSTQASAGNLAVSLTASVSPGGSAVPARGLEQELGEAGQRPEAGQ